MFKVIFHTESSWFTDTSLIGRARTVEDGLQYLAGNLKYLLPQGKLYALDGSLWCQYYYDSDED